MILRGPRVGSVSPAFIFHEMGYIYMNKYCVSEYTSILDDFSA